MKKNGKKITAAMLIMAALLFVFSGAGAARATLTESETYTSQFEMKNVSIALLENGTEVATDDTVEHQYGPDALLKGLLGDDTNIKIGKMYPEVLTVKNTGDIDQYVRVTLYKYWTKDIEQKDTKQTNLTPDLIKLGLNEEDWIIADNEGASPEQVVLYYKKPLAPGETTEPVLNTIGLDTDVAKIIQRDEEVVKDGKVITTTYIYDSVSFGLEADVDGVQTHSAKDAIKSAWGVDVTIAEDGSLSL